MSNLPATTPDGEIIGDGLAVVPRRPTVPVPLGDGTSIKIDKDLASIPFIDDEMMEALLIKKVFDAPSLEEAMEPLGEADNFEQYAGKVITIHFTGLRPSAMSKRLNVFGIIDAEIDETKAQAIITCGSARVLAVIARAYKEGRIPLRCKVAMGVASPGKHAPYYLIDADRF